MSIKERRAICKEPSCGIEFIHKKTGALPSYCPQHSRQDSLKREQDRRNQKIRDNQLRGTKIAKDLDLTLQPMKLAFALQALPNDLNGAAKLAGIHVSIEELKRIERQARTDFDDIIKGDPVGFSTVTSMAKGFVMLEIIRTLSMQSPRDLPGVFKSIAQTEDNLGGKNFGDLNIVIGGLDPEPSKIEEGTDTKTETTNTTSLNMEDTINQGSAN